MSDALDRRDRLAEYSGERGSMVLVTERRRALKPMTCEVCSRSSDGGIARGVVLDEPGVGTWSLWMLPDGFSMADHGEISVCSQHQSDGLLRVMRFAD